MRGAPTYGYGPLRCEHRPSSPTLSSEGKTTSRGAPKNPLQLGATLWYFRQENRVISPPAWVQNLILPPLAALAKVFGVRPYYDRWDTRLSAPEQTQMS